MEEKYNPDVNHEIEKAPTLPPNPKISVVMPTRNEESHIEKTLKDLLDQDYSLGEFEILVVDGRSSDKTTEIVNKIMEKEHRLKLIDNPQLLAGSARNLGVKHSSGEIIAIVDAHCKIPDNHLLQNIAEKFICSRAYSLCRPQPIYVHSPDLFSKALDITRSSPLGHSPDSLIYETEIEGFVNPTSAAAMFHREVFDKIGYFKENIDACEDLEFNIRLSKAKLASYFSPSLMVYYYPRRNLKQLFHHMYRYGNGRFKVFLLHTDILFNILYFIPSLLVLFIILTPLIILLLPPIRLIWIILLFLYLILIMSESARLSFKHGWNKFLIFSSQFFAIHFGWGMGMISAFAQLKIVQKLRKNSKS